MTDQNTPTTSPDPLDKPFPIWVIVIMPFYAGLFMALVLFPLAGDWRWLEGWMYNAVFMLITGISYFKINQENPRVIRNRMKFKKKGLSAVTRPSASSDRFILPFVGVGFFGAFILPSLGHRYGWVSVAFLVEIMALLIVIVGNVIMSIAMLQNAYASKLLDINQDQKLIDTGLYARVRHPLYAGAALMILATPIALGSWWGVLPACVAVVALILRIKYEEEMLVQGMQGYVDYQKRVPYKLIPGIF